MSDDSTIKRTTETVKACQSLFDFMNISLFYIHDCMHCVTTLIKIAFGRIVQINICDTKWLSHRPILFFVVANWEIRFFGYAFHFIHFEIWILSERCGKVAGWMQTISYFLKRKNQLKKMFLWWTKLLVLWSKFYEMKSTLEMVQIILVFVHTHLEI